MTIDSGILGDPADWHHIFKTAKPDARTPEQRHADDQHLHDCILWGRAFEQDKLAEADEKEVCDLIYDALEHRYAEHIASKETLSDASKRQYTVALKQFYQFCADASAGGVTVRDHPARPATVASFLHEQRAAGASAMTIRRLSAAISWAHRLFDLFDPCSDPLVRAVVVSARGDSEATDADH